MDIRKLTEGLSVSPQISASDVDRLAAEGFRTLISNRPDGEEPGQPDQAGIAAAADRAGLAFLHLPVSPGMVEDATAQAFRAALDRMPGPVLAYCRSGTRSTVLWAIAEAGRRPLEEILSVAREAGYDLSAVAPRLALQDGKPG